MQAILAGSRLPTLSELEERLIATEVPSAGQAPSIADLLGPIDAAVARHAALIEEPLTVAPDPMTVDAHVAAPPAEFAPAPLADIEPEPEPWAFVEPEPEPESEPESEPVSEPWAFVESEPEPEAVEVEDATPTTPLRRTTDRLLVDSPSGRDWDAEISRSAELSPLIERSLGAAGTTVTDAPEPWRATTESRRGTAGDTAPSDVLGPFGEVLLPAVAGPRIATGAETAIEVDTDPALVTGDVIELLEVSGLTFENDPMAVPQRPMAEPVLASEPGQVQALTDTRSPRRRRRRAPQAVAMPRRRRGVMRRLLRFLLVAIILAAVVIGGYLAVERFVLATRWPVSLQPVSHFIEERTGLQFERSIVVEEVPRAEFDAIVSEVRLGLPLAVSETTVSDVMASSRALGLWSGEYDPAAATRVVSRAWPAVYDPVSGIVYVDADVTDNDRRKAFVARELTLGLFDQVYGWSERLATATGGERLAYRTRMEAEALAVASAWLRDLEGKPVALDEMPPTMSFPDIDDEAWGAVPDAQEVTVRVPLVSGAPAATGEVADLDEVPANDGALLFATLSGDEPPALGAVGDRDVLAAGLGPQGPQGAAFWLTVLQSRENPTDAIAAMRGHRSDDTRTLLSDTDGDGSFDRVCVEARLSTAGRVSGDLLFASFERWAAMAPPQSQTTITRERPTVVAVRACDPGTTATTATRPTAAFDTVWFVATRAGEAATAAGDDG